MVTIKTNSPNALRALQDQGATVDKVGFDEYTVSFAEKSREEENQDAFDKEISNRILREREEKENG